MNIYFKKCIITFFYILIISELFSCITTTNNNTVYINADLKKYYDYQTGSYLIFYESLNNYLDSSNISYYDYITYNNDRGEEMLDLDMGGFHLRLGDTAWTTDTFYFGFIVYNIYSSIEFSKGYSNYFICSFTYSIPFLTGQFAIGTHGGLDAININTNLLPTYTIGNITYNNVYEVAYSYTNTAYADTIYM